MNKPFCSYQLQPENCRKVTVVNEQTQHVSIIYRHFKIQITLVALCAEELLILNSKAYFTSTHTDFRKVESPTS